MAANFNSKSLFSEHLKSSNSARTPEPARPRNTATSLDDIFGSKPATSTNRAKSPGRINLKTW